MMPYTLALSRRVALALAGAFLLGAAPPMRLLRTEPRPNQVMSGSGVAFALHFDHPLDHQASRFMLMAPDGVTLTVLVRLGAQPNVLYGSVGQLRPGTYVLNWSARGNDGAALTGTLPFEIRG